MRNWKSRSITAIFFGCCALAAAVFLIGCGLKGNPTPLVDALPPGVKDLEVGRSSDGNRIVWTLPGGGTGVERVKIFRSALDVQNGSCPGCPAAFNLISEPLVQELRKDLGSGRVSFRDPWIKPGFHYTYKIILCDDTGYCGSESNAVSIDWKPADGNKDKAGTDDVAAPLPEK